jgi:hypothetical protein
LMNISKTQNVLKTRNVLLPHNGLLSTVKGVSWSATRELSRLRRMP